MDVDDLRKATMSAKRDQAMQVSDVYMMGACVLRVYEQDEQPVPKRSTAPSWCKITETDQQNIDIKMKAIEVRRDRRIGVVSRDRIRGENDDRYKDAYANNGRDLNEEYVPTEWFGLVKAQFGVVRNQRPATSPRSASAPTCGVSTTVCSTSTVPTADDLADNDEDDVNIQVRI